MSFLKNINQTEFLKSYWEKKHLFLPNSFKDANLSLTKSSILNMALDEEIESRLIAGPENNDWELEFGPLEDLSFVDSNKKWTLFIHNFNLYESFSKNIQKQSEFIPPWLFDDVLCSISSNGASVGAHFDRYNVFIIQISGKRLWKIQTAPKKHFKKDCSIKVLEEFSPEVEYELSPGDMIFIPPECAHEGTSIGESISLSLGFKSLETSQLMQFFASELLESIDETNFIKTGPEDFSSMSSEVSKIFVTKVYKKMLKQMSSQDLFKDALLKFMTQTKSPNELENPEINEEEFHQELKVSKVQFIDEIRYLTYEEELWINQCRIIISKSGGVQLINLIEQGSEFNGSKELPEIQMALHKLYLNDCLGFTD